jgi:hypothetical protein
VTKKQWTSKDNIINVALTILFLLGVISIILSSYVYHKTFILWTIPVVIWLITGLVTALLTTKVWDKQFIKTHFALKAIYSLISVGSLFCCLFLCVNYYVKDLSEKTKRYKIIGRSEIRSKGQSSTNLPRVYINTKLGTKELLFNYPEKYSIVNCDSIELTLRRGMFGFPVIDKYEFIEKNYR